MSLRQCSNHSGDSGTFKFNLTERKSKAARFRPPHRFDNVGLIGRRGSKDDSSFSRQPATQQRVLNMRTSFALAQFRNKRNEHFFIVVVMIPIVVKPSWLFLLLAHRGAAVAFVVVHHHADGPSYISAPAKLADEAAGRGRDSALVADIPNSSRREIHFFFFICLLFCFCFRLLKTTNGESFPPVLLLASETNAYFLCRCE